MSCACDKGAADGKTFTEYVDFITDSVLSYPAAKDAISQLKRIGNDANHKVQFVNKADAERAMKIATYMLTAIYPFPAA